MNPHLQDRDQPAPNARLRSSTITRIYPADSRYRLSADLVPYDAKIINLVHDEILVEVSEEEAQQVKEVMRKSMIRAGEDFIITIPVQVDIAADRVWRK